MARARGVKFKLLSNTAFNNLSPTDQVNYIQKMIKNANQQLYRLEKSGDTPSKIFTSTFSRNPDKFTKTGRVKNMKLTEYNKKNGVSLKTYNDYKSLLHLADVNGNQMLGFTKANVRNIAIVQQHLEDSYNDGKPLTQKQQMELQEAMHYATTVSGRYYELMIKVIEEIDSDVLQKYGYGDAKSYKALKNKNKSYDELFADVKDMLKSQDEKHNRTERQLTEHDLEKAAMDTYMQDSTKYYRSQFSVIKGE